MDNTERVRDILGVGTVVESWRIVCSQVRTWIACSGIALVGFAGYLGLFYARLAREMRAGHATLELDIVITLVGAAVGSVLFGGMFSVALRQLDSRPIAPVHMLGAVRVFWHLYALHLLYGTLGLLGERLPWSYVISPIVTSLAGGLFIVSMPMIVDGRAGALGAVARSCALLARHAIRAVVFFWAVSIMSFAGVLLCGFGLVLTLPVYFVSTSLVYRALAGPSVR